VSVKKETEVTFSGTNTPDIYIGPEILAGIEIGNDNDFDNKTLSITVSSEDKNYKSLYNAEGVAFPSILIGKSRIIYFDLPITAPVKYIKFTASASLNGKKIKVFTYRDN
jgi:hypothetical protein